MSDEASTSKARQDVSPTEKISSGKVKCLFDIKNVQNTNSTQTVHRSIQITIIFFFFLVYW